MRLGLAKHITLEHIKPIGRSAGALGRRAAAEKRDMCVLKRLRITLTENLSFVGVGVCSLGRTYYRITPRATCPSRSRIGIDCDKDG